VLLGGESLNILSGATIYGGAYIQVRPFLHIKRLSVAPPIAQHNAPPIAQHKAVHRAVLSTMQCSAHCSAQGSAVHSAVHSAVLNTGRPLLSTMHCPVLSSHRPLLSTGQCRRQERKAKNIPVGKDATTTCTYTVRIYRSGQSYTSSV
jgi:hypothetical protein